MMKMTTGRQMWEKSGNNSGTVSLLVFMASFDSYKLLPREVRTTFSWKVFGGVKSVATSPLVTTSGFADRWLLPSFPQTTALQHHITVVSSHKDKDWRAERKQRRKLAFTED